MSALSSHQPIRQKHLSLIVPFFNEGAGVEVFHKALGPVLAGILGYQIEIICIDDGSTDDTLDRLLPWQASIRTTRSSN